MALPESLVEVAYARPERQWVVSVRWREGMTAIEAVDASGLLRELTELQRDTLLLGIFGRRVAADEPVRAGDRVEIYRQLLCDPRAARRRTAQAARPARRSRSGSAPE